MNSLPPIFLSSGKRLLFQCHERDVRIAVVVEVAKIEAHAPNEVPILGQRRSGLECNLFELLAQIVKEEVVEGIVGDEDVGPTIQVVVRDADAHSLPHMRPNAPCLGNVFENAVAFVQEELVRQALVSGPDCSSRRVRRSEQRGSSSYFHCT